MAKTLQDFVKQTIAPYKYPRAIEFRTSLPRTETGKLQRFRLRQESMHARPCNRPAGRRREGYANGVVARGDWVVLAGQIGWNAQAHSSSDDLVAQMRQALLNVRALLAEAGCRARAHRAHDLVRARQARVPGARHARSAPSTAS